MNVGDISEPLKVGKNWSLFKILAVKEPEYKSLESVRNKLLVDFRRDKRKRLIDIFEIYLTETYRPQYYFENLDNTLAEGTVE